MTLSACIDRNVSLRRANPVRRHSLIRERSQVLTLLSVEKLRSTPAVVTGSVTRIVNESRTRQKLECCFMTELGKKLINKNFPMDQSRGRSPLPPPPYGSATAKTSTCVVVQLRSGTHVHVYEQSKVVADIA